jgi:hypothetical protein
LIGNDSYNYATGYQATDLTGDNFIDLSDLTICDNNGYNFVGKVTPTAIILKRETSQQQATYNK